ncbi:hypothetical protein O9929_18610 [Vibrio lentus]|nr:hypothetical protein [Vibrio lentus]
MASGRMRLKKRTTKTTSLTVHLTLRNRRHHTKAEFVTQCKGTQTESNFVSTDGGLTFTPINIRRP